MISFENYWILVLLYGIGLLNWCEQVSALCDGEVYNSSLTWKGCIRFGKNAEPQWGVCLSESILSKHHMRCQLSGRKSCWYPCELAIYGNARGRVPRACTCNRDDKQTLSELGGDCYIHRKLNIGDCGWFDRCLLTYLQKKLTCHMEITNIVEIGERICKANEDIFMKVPIKKRALLELWECLQTSFTTFLFDEPDCGKLKIKLWQESKICFVTAAMKRLLSYFHFNYLRYLVYHTLKAELQAISGKENLSDISELKWFWDYRLKVRSDILNNDAFVKRFLFTLSYIDYTDSIIPTLASNLNHALNWESRCIKFDYKIFHHSTKKKILYAEISTFPSNKLDLYTNCNKEVSMATEVDNILGMLESATNDPNVRVLGIMYCKDRTDVCSEEIRTATSKSSSCEAIGGKCIDNSYNHCLHITEKSECSSNQKCCIEQADDTTCPSIGGECIYDSEECTNGINILAKCGMRRHCCYRAKDQPCRDAGGHCQYNTYSCSGSYQKGLCAGSVNRQCCISAGQTSSDYLCYGDIMSLEPKGRSHKGVSESYPELKPDITTLNEKKDCYVTAGKNSCIHPALIAALASRESHAGRLLYKTNGWGDNNNAYGVLQCDIRHCPVCNKGNGNLKCTTYDWNSCEHIDMMTKYVLVSFIKQVQKKHPTWPKNHQLQGGVAAYNFGPKNVQSWDNLDKGSTGDDYSNDVIARAQLLVKYHGW